MILFLTVAPVASAGRIGHSPYVFSKAQVAQAPALVKAAMRAQFGKSERTMVSCKGFYPGRHGGVSGFHEIHCSFTVVILDAVGKSGVVVYWVDASKRVRDVVRWD